ncbi:hypothetical protein BGX23_011789, partial [Mortierella sp. AD031]
MPSIPNPDFSGYRIPVQGDSPALFTRYCMVSALNGQKLLVFGGSQQDQVNRNIAIFDTVTNTWSHGTPSPDARQDMACASAGDYFLLWGGSNTPTGVNTPGDILFYNIKANNWTNQADIAPPVSTTTSTATGSASSAPSTGTPDSVTPASKSNAAAIGGGIAGLLLIVIILGFFLVRRRRQAAAKKAQSVDAAFGDTTDLSGDKPMPPSPSISPHHNSPHGDTVSTYNDPSSEYDENGKIEANIVGGPQKYPLDNEG